MGSILRRVSTRLDHEVRHRVAVDLAFDEPVIEKQAAQLVAMILEASASD